MITSTIFGKGPDDVKETARIIAVEGKLAKAQLEVNSACGECSVKGFCHPDSGPKPVIEIDNEIMASAGDVVVLEVKPSSRIGSSLAVFGIPILMVAVGAGLGGVLGNASQDSAAAGAIAGLALGLLIVRLINRLVKRSARIRPRAVKVVSRANA